jgi:predicted ATPase/DNA-binding winged helix-turn-helix (wHTH) protein
LDATPRDYRFGHCTLEHVERRLLIDGRPARLGSRAFDVLLALIEHRHSPLSKQALIDRVWPDRVVAENNLEVQVWALRKLLGANAIVTVPGRGYRFAIPLEPAVTVPTAAAQTAAAPPRAFAPHERPRLIGREGELRDLRHAIDEHRVVTVAGIGGIGKSLLAQHLLAVERDRRPHGGAWVDLAPLSDPGLVTPTVAAALDVPLAGSDLRRALAAVAAPLQMLVVIDNAEHLAAEVAAVVQALLDAAPGLQFVVTSQVPLKLAAERVLRLGPLAAPHAALPPAEALHYAAVALFVERVRAVQWGFELTDDNVDAVCSLCRRLDGSALAIELAAARVPLLGVAGLERGLDARLDMLTKGRRDAPARQHTLRAALAWTHALLGADEQRLFRRLSVFAGGFSLELAQQVVCDVSLDSPRLLGALDALVDFSLVAVDAADPPRYRLLESPLALARERLDASGEAPALRARHAQAVTQRFLAVAADSAGDRLPPAWAKERLAPDLDNGRAAMAWALHNDATMAIAFVDALTAAMGRLRAVEGRRLWPATEALLDPGMPDSLRLRWTIGASLFHFTERRNAEACVHARRAIVLARQLRDDLALARALSIIAAADDTLGADERRAAKDEMLALETPLTPLRTRINNAQAEFVHATRVGDLDACESAGRRWLELTREPGWDYERGVALNNMADLALARDQPQLAAQLGRELEGQLRESRHVRSLTVARTNLATALLACGDLAGARAMAELAWPMAPAWRLQPYLGVSLALLATLEGRPRAGAALHGFALARLAEAGLKVEINEDRALRRTEMLARAALGDARFDALHRVGESWPDERAGTAGLARIDID